MFLAPAGAEARAVRAGAGRAAVATFRAGAVAGRTLPAALPPAVTVVGLCGALRAGLMPGTVVVYGSVADDTGEFALDSGLAGALPGAYVVRAQTSARVLTRAGARAELHRRTGADVVDMEGTHLAAALAARGISVTMVRIVSDGPDADLPPLDDAFAADGTLRPLALALAFARAPRAAVRFVADVRRALAALEAVVRTITATAA